MTERQLEMLNNDFRYLAGIVHLQTTDKTLLATKFRVSWPTMQKKVTNLLKAGIIVDKGDSYKINPDILATSLFIGIYLLSNDTISPAKGLITLDTCEKKAISTLFKHNTDQISLFEAKDIVLHKIIPFMQFVHPSILIVGGALASQDVSSFVYSDFKALNISEVKFDDSNFAKSIACFAMSKFFEGRE